MSALLFPYRTVCSAIVLATCLTNSVVNAWGYTVTFTLWRNLITSWSYSFKMWRMLANVTLNPRLWRRRVPNLAAPCINITSCGSSRLLVVSVPSSLYDVFEAYFVSRSITLRYSVIRWWSKVKAHFLRVWNVISRDSRCNLVCWRIKRSKLVFNTYLDVTQCNSINIICVWWFVLFTRAGVFTNEVIKFPIRSLRRLILYFDDLAL